MSPFFSPTKVLDSIILMQLEIEGPLYGYALASAFEAKFGWKPSQTAIYNALKSMEQDELVTVEEKIENGRVQKIYTITKKGKSTLEEIHELMKKHMMKNFTQVFSFIQMLIDSESSEESKTYQETIQSVLKNFHSISRLTFMLLKEEPEKTQIVIEETLKSLKKIAAELDLEFQDDEEEDMFP
ncbi:MAG: helix-turn-helix transcriptional regulator [Candidatus Heimdallarchaeota archaeon]|nr:helix-turn-helix transcriptional regulator [Candidatus Heimdallarchaeota archaeon]